MPVWRRTCLIVRLVLMIALGGFILSAGPANAGENIRNLNALGYQTTFSSLSTEKIDNLGYKYVYTDFGPPDSAFEKNGPWHEWVEMLQPKDSFLSRHFNTVDDRLHIYTGGFLTFDDNIYKSEKNEKNDVIRTQIAGMDVRSERFEEGGDNKYYFQLLSEFRFDDYSRHDSEDHSEFDIAPQFDYKFNELFKVEYQGSYRKSASSTDRTEADTILHYRADSILNLSITPSDKWGVDISGLFRDKYYPLTIDQLYEAREFAGMIAPYYQVNENLKVGLDATLGDIDYDHDIQNDASYSEGRVSALYTYKNWTYYLAIGYHSRDYDTSGTDPDRTDYSGVTYNSSIRYTDPGYKWDVGLRASMLPVETSAGNYSLFSRYAIDASYIPIDPLRLRAEAFAEYSNQSNYYDDRRNGISTSVSWSFSEYASTGVSYQHVRNIASAPDSDYISNLVSVGLWFTF